MGLRQSGFPRTQLFEGVSEAPASPVEPPTPAAVRDDVRAVPREQRVEAPPILGLVLVHALNPSMSGMRASVRRQSTSARQYLNVATSQPATATTGSTMKAAVTERVSSGTATSEAVERIEFAQPATVKRARPSEE